VLSSLIRIVVGFVAACLASGAAQTLFVVTPNDLIADSTRLASTGLLMLMAATQSAVFAIPFAGLAIAVTEWFGRRAWIIYALAGIAVAMTGYTALIAAESGPQTLFNDYAFRAFLVAGLAAGVVYWLVSGRYAGSWHRPVDGPGENSPREDPDSAPEPETSPA
jgi:hypothetical protein